MASFDDPDGERDRLEVAREEQMMRRERQDRLEDYTPAPTSLSLPPRVLLKQRQNRERLEMLRRHEAEQRALHEPDCPRPSHGGPCKGPLRFGLAATALEVYERHLEAIMATLRRWRFEVRAVAFPTEGVVSIASRLACGEWTSIDNLRRGDSMHLGVSEVSMRELAEAVFAAADVGI